MKFKYPVGSEVVVKQLCDVGETHRKNVVILAAFVSFTADDESRNFYAVETDAVGGRPFCVHENLIIGRVNVRTNAAREEKA